MTALTENGITTLTTTGEQHQTFIRTENGKKKKYVQYDYRHTNGKLFSCIKKTLQACRVARDEWITKQ